MPLEKPTVNPYQMRVFGMRLPETLMLEIEDVARLNEAKFHRRTGKPVLTNTIKSLLELGLKEYKNGRRLKSLD